ncbi:protein CDV3 homolog [Drosophila innubila]|uniref:protein CDV3 homolog n=1 Tax=Drosophila innubila TaxID=198719 RepID=UPI00148BA908|nr:protein CDV3 homolog [Drosophila innubila]
MSSLDDFFAKKDRKKSATKTNLLAADELYRTLEETTKVAQEVDSNEKVQLEISSSSHVPLEFGVRFSDEACNEEDEWCDFTEDHDQPFPNLKWNSKLVLSPTVVINVEDIKTTTEHCQYQDTGGDGIGVGQCTEDMGRSACPWLKLEPVEIPNCRPKMIESLEEKYESDNKLQSNIVVKNIVYVPPALRESQSEISVRPNKQVTPVTSKLNKAQAPDLNNIDFFPLLCSSRISKRAK